MKRLFFLSVIFSALFFAAFISGNTVPLAYALDDPPFFDGHTQWNQTEALRIELFGEYVVRSNVPVQYGSDKRYGNSPARHREGVQLQYRLFDDPAMGRVELGVFTRIDTRDDAPDSLQRGPVELTYTLPKDLSDRFRITLGFSDRMNIGTHAGSTREIGSTYIALGAKVFESEQWLVSADAIYHFSSTVPSHVVNPYDGARNNPLRAEFGPQVFWRAHPFVTMMAGPSVGLDGGLKPTMVGLKSGMVWAFGPQFFPKASPLSKFSWFIGEEYRTNLQDNEFMKKNAFQLTMGLRLRF